MLTAKILLIAVLVLIAFGFLIAFVKLFKQGYFKTIFLIVALPFLAYEIFQCYSVIEVLPPEIEIKYPISIGFGDGCGVAAFKLSDKTMQSIRSHGLRFFEVATQARGYPNPQGSSSYSNKKQDDYFYNKYENWRETPAPESWVSKSAFLFCPVISDGLSDTIYKATKLPNSFYTNSPKGQLVVIPSLGYVVFSFYNI